MKKLWLLLVPFAMNGQKILDYPAAEISSATENYGSTSVPDPYNWLESAKSTRTITWLDEEDKVTAKYAKKCSYLGGALTKIQRYSVPEYKPVVKKGKYYFRPSYSRDGRIAVLYVQPNLTTPETPLVIAADFKTETKTHPFLEQYEVSADDRFLLVSMSTGHDRTLRVFSMDRQKALPDKIDHAAGGEIAWVGNGFLYTLRDSLRGESSRRLMYHKLGHDVKKDKEIYSFQAKEAGHSKYKVTTDEHYLLVQDVVDNNSTKTVSYAKLDSFPGLKLLPVISVPVASGNEFSVVDNIGGNFLVMTDKDAPNGKVVLYDPSKGVNQSKDIVKSYKNTLTQTRFSKNSLICQYFFNGAYSVSVFDTTGKSLKTMNFPIGCTVSGFDARYYESETFYTVHSFYFPEAVYRFDTEKFTSEPLSKTPIAYDPKGFDTKLVRYKMSDSSEVPMYVTYKKGMKNDGTNPAILYADAGIFHEITPAYNPANIAWLETGGIIAVPDLDNHTVAGWRTAGDVKRNIVDKFITAAKYLVSARYTSPGKLALSGVAGGGLVVGVAMTKNPELFKAAVPESGAMDMVRYYPPTAHPEICDRSAGEQPLPVMETSPLQAIQKGKAYPATLAVTDDEDSQIPSYHDYKFVATLQEKGSPEIPYILKVVNTAGGSPATIAKARQEAEALKLAFLFKTLDVNAAAVYAGGGQ